MVLVGFKYDLDDQLVSFSAVGLVIWPLKIVPEMTYYVSSGTLNPTHSLTHYPTINLNPRKSAPYDHNVRPSQTDGRTDENHGNSTKIHSTNASPAKNRRELAVKTCFPKLCHCGYNSTECSKNHRNMFQKFLKNHTSSTITWLERTPSNFVYRLPLNGWSHAHKLFGRV